MVEYLIALVQCLCLCGYLYGAYVVITHVAVMDSAPGSRQRAHRAQPDEEYESVAWRRYLAYDS